MHISSDRSTSRRGGLHVVSFSIMVVGAYTRCELLHSLCNLKASQKNVQCNQVWELMPFEFELGHNATKVTNKSVVPEGKYNNKMVKNVSLKLQEPRRSGKAKAS